MIGAIAGDIIGSRFEGKPSPLVDFDLFHPDCRFTDDTVCSLAVADALLRNADFAESLRRHVRQHPRRGYGGLFLAWALQDGAPAYGSWGNGAPMRVAAVGWLADDESRADELAAAQAAVSHNHPDAVAASQAVARAILALRRGSPAAAVRDRLAERFGYALGPEAALSRRGFEVSAAGTVPPALSAALHSENWEAAVRRVVALGGDTDTLACITGAVAEAIHGVPAGIAGRARAYLTEDLASILDRFDQRVAEGSA